MDFEELLKENRSSVETYVRYRIDSRADREDLLQEIYTRAFERFGSLKDEGSFRAWIVSIARNMCSDYYREKAQAEHVPYDDSVHPVVSVHRTVNERVYEALDGLAQQQRDILRFYYWEELPLKEIGEKLGIPEGTVKSRLHAARKRFGELYTKEDEMNRIMPDVMPEYTIKKTYGKPFEVLWEELMGWFLVPKEGNRLRWAIYDFPERKRSEIFEMSCGGKAEIHGLQGVRVEAVETLGKKKVRRHFIAQLTDTHCRYLAESHEEDGVEKLYTFLDGDAFLSNWGFGPENIGNETHLKQKGLIRRNGNVVTTDGPGECMDIVGRYDVTINGRTYDTVCLMDIGSYDDNTVSEQYIDASGHTVLWRRFNKKGSRWLFSGFEDADGDALKDAEKLLVNGEECPHWYDCITEYVL